jgi:serine/threonine-protein kinase
MVQSQAGQPKSSSKLPIAIGAVALAALGGVGVYFATRVPAATPQPAAQTQPEAPPAPPPTPTPTATAAPVETAAALAPAAVRRVKVLILPSDASVMVEDKLVPVKDGEVEISGPLGSRHKVKVWKGKSPPVEQDVVVTESGAFPLKVEFKYGALKPATTGAPATPGAPATAPPVLPGINDKFE